MRAAVIVLNTISIVAALASLPVAFYIGAWGLLGPSYGRPQDAVIGVALMAAPFVITALCVILSVRAMRRGTGAAPFIAAIPACLVAVGAAILLLTVGSS